jgi:hypothetical protein
MCEISLDSKHKCRRCWHHHCARCGECHRCEVKGYQPHAYNPLSLAEEAHYRELERLERAVKDAPLDILP